MRPLNVPCLLVLLSFMSISAQEGNAGFLTVSGAANIFGAGQATPPDPGGGGGGVLPPSFAFASGAGQILTFSSVIGTISLAAGESENGDGYLGASTNVDSYGGISGLSYAGRHGFLVGVFLDNSAPVAPAPTVLSYSGGDTIPSFSPLLDQTFFVGLGQTDGGVIQQFYVPTGATRLYLGFVDALGYSGAPGYYGDNTGSLGVTFNLSGTVPEPSSLILTSMSTLFGLGYWTRKRHRIMPPCFRV